MHCALFIKSDFRVALLNICAAGKLLTKAQSLIGHFGRKKNVLICLSEVKIFKHKLSWQRLACKLPACLTSLLLTVKYFIFASNKSLIMQESHIESFSSFCQQEAEILPIKFIIN